MEVSESKKRRASDEVCRRFKQQQAIFWNFGVSTCPPAFRDLALATSLSRKSFRPPKKPWSPKCLNPKIYNPKALRARTPKPRL